jgi:hypothetical protein
MNEEDGFFKEIFNQEKEELKEKKKEEEKKKNISDNSNSSSDIPIIPSFTHMNIYNSVALHEAFYKSAGVKPSFIANAIKYLAGFCFLYFISFVLLIYM